MIGTNEKSDRSAEVADPDLGCTGVEIEGAFFVDLGRGVGWGENLDTDFGCAGKHNWPIVEFRASRSEPYDIDGFDTIGGGNRTFGQSTAFGEEAFQQVGNLALAICVRERGRGTHKDVAVPIRLHAVWEPGELGIGQ